MGGDHIQVLNGHALPDDTLHTAKADAELVLQQLAHAAQAAVAQMVDIVLGDQAVSQGVHIVDGGENIVHDDVLGHQLIGVLAALIDELLALILAQQLLQHVKAHPLLDTAGSLGIKVHIAAHITHAVGKDADGGAVIGQNGHLTHADGIQLPALLAGEDVALIKEDLSGGGVSHRQGQLAIPGNGPKGQLLIELIAAHDAQVIAPGIEEQIVQQSLSGIQRGGLAGTQLAVDFQHGLLIGLAAVLFQCGHNALVIAEAVENLGVSLEPQGADQASDGELAVFINTNPEHLAGVGLILQPGTPIGDNRRRQQGQVGLQVRFLAVVDAGRADDLADHHTLGAVDDEGSGVGHQGEVPHEYLLLLDFARLLIVQAHTHLHGSRIGGIPGLALLHIVLGLLIHAEVDEAQLQVAGIVADGGHIRKYLPQTGIQEPLIALLLDLQQVGHRHDLFVPGKILTQGFAVILILGHLQYSRLSCFYLNLICLLFSGLLRGARRIICDTHGLVASFMGHPLVFFADRWYPMNRL